MMEWVPDDCRLPKSDASLFCELLGTRKMLLIGDSTMAQTATVLMNAIYAAQLEHADINAGLRREERWV